MVTYIRITSETLRWFVPLLPEEERQAVEQGRRIYAIGAVRDRTACGVLVFQVGAPAVEIRFLAVADGFRRQGVARGMVEYLCRYAWEQVSPVVCIFAAAHRSDPIYLFFAGLEHFSLVQEEGFCCQVPLADLSRSPRLAALDRVQGQVQSFFSLPQAEQRKFMLQIRQNGIPFPEEEQPYCKHLCLCATGTDGAVEAAVFLAEDGADLELTSAWCAPGRQRSLMTLLARVCTQLPEGPGWLRIAAVTPQSAALVDKLLPQRQITARYYRAAWDME